MKKLVLMAISLSLFIRNSQGQVYQVIDLGPACGQPAAINNSGWVTWCVSTIFPGKGSLLYRNGETVNINDGIPCSISDSGIIAGQEGADGGFMWQSNRTSIVFPGVTVTGVNSNGTVIANGTFAYINSQGQGNVMSGGLYYQNGTVNKLLGVGYDNTSITASAINNRGTIVGSLNRKAVAWFDVNSLPIDLGVTNSDSVVAVSSDDRIIGYSSAGSWLWQNGVLQMTGRPSSGRPFRATSVNSSGQVLGNSYEINGSPILMLWQNGVFTTLDTLMIGTNRCYNFVVGGVINDSGQIAAICRIDSGNTGDQWRAVLITKILAPSISKQPLSQTVAIGSALCLSVNASNSPTNYQWYFGENSIIGATNSWLKLTNVQPAQSGEYTVVISNQAGEITSDKATLSVQPGLSITMIPAVNIGGEIGQTYELDYINSFGPTNAWSPLATITVTNSPQWYFDGSSMGQTQRFYRFVLVP